MSEAGTEMPINPQVLEYLRTRNETLQNDYRTPDGKNSESCSDIALDLAEILVEEGQEPELLQVWGQTESNGRNRKPLVPIVYKGRVTFAGHVVCANGNTVFDPMVGHPMSREDYMRTVFNDLVILEASVPPEEIQAFIDRRRKIRESRNS